MLRKIIAATSIILLFNLAFASSIFCQNKKVSDAEKYKSRIAKRGTSGKPIIVKLKDKTKLKGVINEINNDYFVLVNKKSGASTNIYYDQIKDIDKAFSKTEQTIAIIGAGFGFTVIIVCFIARKCEN